MSGVVDRIRAVVGDGPNECKHERDDIWPDEDKRIWHLEDTYLRDRRYWSERDAAFVELRERVKELRCFGCGEQRTIDTAEMTGNVRWKADMDADEIAEMREETNAGSYYNGTLWWEDNVWDGDAEDVATQIDWLSDIGYQGWKDRSRDTGTNQSKKNR